ncbi:MAG: hypothetical protein OXU19_05130 [bacterium]|nr:hypothetical protein [Rhodospirillaceae bacterium]MDE0045231.1 hypothetical protein [bacterium]MDE0415376.1 hypothetical protein [bacterium]
MMTDERTETGLEIETTLPCRILDDPAAERIVAPRKRLKEGDGGGERTPVWIVPLRR